MKSVVFVFIAVEKDLPDMEKAIRQHLDSPQFIELPSEAVRKVYDAEQMPLWRWFISSK